MGWSRLRGYTLILILRLPCSGRKTSMRTSLWRKITGPFESIWYIRTARLALPWAPRYASHMGYRIR